MQLILSALGGGLIAAFITAWFGARRELDSDRRQLRDRKAERLRRVYGELILTVITMKAKARSWQWEQHAPKGETLEQRGQRIQRILDEAKVNIDKMQAELLLESEGRATQILETFDRLDMRLSLYASAIIDNIQAPDAAEPEVVQKARKDVEAIADELVRVARNDLAETEQPIGLRFPWEQTKSGRPDAAAPTTKS